MSKKNITINIQSLVDKIEFMAPSNSIQPHIIEIIIVEAIQKAIQSSIHLIEIPVENTNEVNCKVMLDQEAYSFFRSYRCTNGKYLPENIIHRYCNEASILGVLKSIYEKQCSARKKSGVQICMDKWWEGCVSFCKTQQEWFPHSLPTNVRSFERKYKAFVKDGYACLVHKGYGFPNDIYCDY